MSMTAVLNPQPFDITQNELLVAGTVTLAGSYATDGVTLDLSQLGIPTSATAPNRIVFWSTVTQGAGMIVDQYNYVPGTNLATGKLQIGVAGSEMAATAFASTTPTNATGYVLNFQAWFPRV